MLHQHDQLDLAPLIHPVAGPVLGGVQEAELALPVPQHVRLQVGELTHLADREELLNGMGDAHRQCSGLSSRSIRSATAWLGDLRLKRTSASQAVADLMERSEEHTSELQSLAYLVCRLLLEKKKKNKIQHCA